MKRILSLVLTLILAISSLSVAASAQTYDADYLLNQWEKQYAINIYDEVYSKHTGELKKFNDKLAVVNDWVYVYKNNNKRVNGELVIEYSKEPILVGYVGQRADLTIPVDVNGEKVRFHSLYSLVPILTLRVPKEIEDLKGTYWGGDEYSGPDEMFFIEPDSLEEIIVDKDNKNYSSKDGVLYSKSGKIAYLYPKEKKDKKFTLPETVEVLDWQFMNNPKYLKELVITEGVKKLYDASISSATLEKLYLKNDSVKDGDLTYLDSSESFEIVDIYTPNAVVYCVKNSVFDRYYHKNLNLKAVRKEYSNEHTDYSNYEIFYDNLEKHFKTVKYLSSPKTPKTPSVKSTSYTEKGIKLTLKDYSANGVKVYRKSGKTYKYIGYTTTKTFYDKTAKAGKTYTYKLRAYNKKNGATANSKYSAVFKVTAKPKTPAAVTIKSATYSKEKGVKLTVKDYSAKGVKVYRKSGKSYKYIGYTTTKTFYDKTAKSGKTYTYKVRAYNKVKGMTANSKYSAAKTVKTTAK